MSMCARTCCNYEANPKAGHRDIGATYCTPCATVINQESLDGTIIIGTPICVACHSPRLDNAGTQDFRLRWQSCCQTCHHVAAPVADL